MNTKHLLAIIACLILFNSSSYGQEKVKEEKPSPYDLISKYYNDDFRPFNRGSAYLGLAFSFQDQSLQNTQRLLGKVVDGDRLNYNIEVKGGYFIGDYVMAGLNFQLSSDKFEGTILNSDGDTITSSSISKRYTAVPVLKAYFPLTKTQRLSFFTELGIGLGGGNSVTRDVKNEDEISKTFTNEFTFSLGLTPGICFFAMENFAFEVGVNVIGYTLNRTTSTINEVEQASEIRHNVNLQLNLLSLKLGLAYYF